MDIEDVTIGDSGKYRCRATAKDLEPVNTRYAKLNVNCKLFLVFLNKICILKNTQRYMRIVYKLIIYGNLSLL